MGSRYPIGRGQCWGKEEPIISIRNFCRELCKNGRTDRLAVWIVDSGGPKEAQVQSYSPGGANVPKCEGTLALPGETIESSVCCSDAVLSQIILTTCSLICTQLTYLHIA